MSQILGGPRSTGQRQSNDDPRRLIFACCHPALSRDEQVALTLRHVAGIETGAIARALHVAETTIAKRLRTATRRIHDDAMYYMPKRADLPARLDELVAVLAVIHSAGDAASSEDRLNACDLAFDAEWTTWLVAQLIPDEPKLLGLLAAMQTRHGQVTMAMTPGAAR
jgi:RNA polymerase sigma-70 factor (ECF subfamily)